MTEKRFRPVSCATDWYIEDMGLLMSDKEVMDIRNEIADKLIKPVCNKNGFEVDVDCTNGFTIIPKGDDFND